MKTAPVCSGDATGPNRRVSAAWDGRSWRPLLVVLLACQILLGPGAADAVPACGGASITPSSDYSWFAGSSQFVGDGLEPESGSSYRWLTNGVALEAGLTSEELLLSFEHSVAGANGEAPVASQNLAYGPGRWGECLALATNGRLRFSRTNALSLNEGTVEMWAALAMDGTNAQFTNRSQVLFHYRATNGDYLQICQSTSGILYAGGAVSNQWESAYGSRGGMFGWRTGEWHHLAFTYSSSLSVMSFYVDGLLAAQNNEGHYWPPQASGTTFSLGGDLYGNPAAAYYLDEVRCSGRVASAAEIAARARRTAAPQPNEVWLAADKVPSGRQLAFEFTPASATQAGAPCQSAALLWNGLPITNAEPASTLLPAGTSNFTLVVETAEPTACAYAVGQPLALERMTPFDSGSGTRRHSALITGLSPDPNSLNDVYVRCAVATNFLLHLQYRAISEAHPPFPRKGNLWGWGQWITNGLAAMARVDLWLGAAPASNQIVALRRMNPHLRLLTSINTVEHEGLPDDYYLKDVNGKRIEVWPGSYRLNLTRDYVADYQARYAYQTVLDTGLMADGVFFDNVMTTQSWQTNDIYGNYVHIDADGDGVADDPATLDAAWKAGVFREIRAFRQLMPSAVVSGHSMNIYESGIPELFNGLSIGFWTSYTLEGRLGFDTLRTRYNDWLSQASSPQVTMVESSPMTQISYGYGYSPEQTIPPSTLEFARTFFPYVRFGLAFTLMNDGFFAHEYGDTWHGNPWWYDELDFNLGYPLGPAALVGLPGFASTNLLVNSDFETAITNPWRLALSAGAVAALTRQTTNAASGDACARVDVTRATGTNWHVEFAQTNRSLAAGVTYQLSFMARASASRTIAVNAQKATADWRNYGLSQTLSVTTNWQSYSVAFTANETVSDARIQFFLGAVAGTVWLDAVQLQVAPPGVYRRDFNNGIVYLNATADSVEVSPGSGFRRLSGSQAPRVEYLLDDTSTNFSVTGAWTNLAYDSGQWKAVGPYYHSWAGTLHERQGSAGVASWRLSVPTNDAYTISAWWPAGPRSSNWSAAATYQVLADGVVLAGTNLDQSTNGDQWHDLATVELSAGSQVSVCVSAAAGACVADALHVRSRARYNDGQPAATVRLQPMDGIILQRDQRVLSLPRFSQCDASSSRVSLTLTNLTPGLSWVLERATNLSSPVWTTVQSFTPLGFELKTSDLATAARPCTFYRLRAE
jgi:hypothetical protein